ncbi:trafficking protein particle complex subunit 2-like protein [Parachaetomium inaequale]|uniref:Trafficking protein particle complex subunit 2-like protein n=1 Tax=Parachaetomium inaequale TaxID=2588326 RepID=A0AAN6PKK8_9PEZI|nr:trafficking protein particle complex subunit 2-like protein [Parachaetomium inaequale]
MATAIPSIACLGNNPLHTSIFPSYDPSSNSFRPMRTPLQFSLILSSTLDVFELRSRQNAAAGVGLTGDFGLLHAVDDRLAAYGFETNTGTRFVVIVDMRGRRIDGALAAGLADGRDKRIAGAAAGLREGEMRPVFKAMQVAYIRLMQNPFFDPDDHSPPAGQGGRKITSRKFAEDMRRIGEAWTPGVTSL